MTRPRTPSLKTSASLLAFAALLQACSPGAKSGPGQGPDEAAKSAAPATTAAKPVLTVEAAALRTVQMPLLLGANGEVVAWQEASVGAEVANLRISQVLVEVGQAVRKGQLLATLRDDSVRADLAQQEAAVAEAKATLAQAQANADRAQAMLPSRAISAQDALAAETAQRAAAARLQSAQAALAAQTLRLANTRVTAPDDGVISARTASVGQVAAVGGELFKLVRQGRVEWRAELPAARVLEAAAGQAVRVTLPNGQVVEGRVRQVAPTLSASTRRGVAFVDLPAGSGVKPGMYLSGALMLGERAAQVVPGSAVVVRDGTPYLMVVEAGGRVRATKVTTGRRDAQHVEITSVNGKGVANASAAASPALRVATQGAGFLKDGDVVKVVQPVPQGSAQ